MTIVVKVGGASGNSLAPVLDEVALRPSEYVLVHGGSEEIDRLGTALGRPPRYYTSPSGTVSRHTDAAHLEVVILALAGSVQTRIVRELATRHVPAVGLSGVDGGLLTARRKEGARAVQDGRVVRVADDLSGSLESVRTDLIERLRQGGYVPVIGPPALTPEGEVVNVDADRVAARVAAALHADGLVLLTNVEGVLRDADDPRSLIPRVDASNEAEVMTAARGRMHKKVRAAIEAVRAGVGRVVIGPSATPRPVAAALAGQGTVFV